jgi:hypothetical protein
MKNGPTGYLYPLLLTLIFSFSIAIASPPTTAKGGFFGRESYPKVFDLNDAKQTNLYASTAFRTRHTPFFNELSDSLRSLRAIFSVDSLKITAVYSLWVNEKGAMDSVRVECPDTAKASVVGTLHDRLLKWHFAATLSGSCLVMDAVTTEQSKTESFLHQHRKKVLYGALIAVVALLIFW